MSTSKQPLTAWSFESDNETALSAFMDELFEFSRACVEKPGEESALNACSASRNVWDTVEGMTHDDITIDAQLLRRAIEGIERCVKAVSQMQLPPETPQTVTEHLRQMVDSMTERRDDLSALLTGGKLAFFGRLRANRLAAA